MKPIVKKISFFLSFLVILGIASFVRFTGMNWDQGQYLHPDERFLVMVATSMTWPKTIGEYFSTSQSHLNPQNIGHTFYVYGTWPVIFVKALGELTGKTVYGNLHEIGRPVSALVDMATLFFIFLITQRFAEKIFSKQQSVYAALLASFIYACMLLPIQLSHFFTVDPYLTFALTAMLYGLTFSPSWKNGIYTGTIFALAAAAKISALPALVTIATYIFIYTIQIKKKKDVTQLLMFITSFIFFFICIFRIFMPYLFLDKSLYKINPKVIQNWKELQSYNNPEAWFPPGLQWVRRIPLLYPFLQLSFFGLGLPLTILGLLSIISTSTVALLSLWKNTLNDFSHRARNNSTLSNSQPTTHYPQLFYLLPLSLIGSMFVYQGIQYAMPMRYFWSIFPPLAILIGLTIQKQISKLYSFKSSHHSTLHRYFALITHNPQPTTIVFLLLTSLLWPLSYMSIYRTNNTRIEASEWIYTHIPHTAIISSEHWDDGLPLSLSQIGNNGIYKTEEIPIYNPESPQKWNDIKDKLNNIDYLILSSNRGYGAILQGKNRFPETARYYKKLFSGQLGFIPVAQFVSRPTLSIPFLHLCIRLPFFSYGDVDALIENQNANNLGDRCNGLVIVDDYADETWTVYDHPKVTIFKKISDYPRDL